MSQSADEYRDLPEGFPGITRNVSACKTIGTLNIIFGAGLLLLGLCCGLQLFAQKTLAPMFTFLWLRATFPRYRYDQIMRLGWKALIPVTLVWLTVEGFMAYIHVGPWRQQL